MAKPIEVTDSQFDEEVLQAELPVMVDFWAAWCGPCKIIAPIVEELAGEYDGKIKFAKLDVLIRDADDRIQRLERLTIQAGRPGVDVTVDDDGSHTDLAPTDGNGDGLTDEQRKIYGLADAGRTAFEIAQQTGQNPGEVELILALRRKVSS